ASSMGRCRAMDAMEIEVGRRCALALRSPAHEWIRKLLLRFWKLCGLLGFRPHSMLWRGAKARSTRSGAPWNSHLRRLDMKPAALSGSIKQPNLKTAWLQGSWRSDGTT